jgi:hypothetical protein
MATKNKAKKAAKVWQHGEQSELARTLKRKHPDMSYAEIGRRCEMTTQGARNAIAARNRIGSKSRMRAEALTPNKLKKVA